MGKSIHDRQAVAEEKRAVRRQILALRDEIPVKMREAKSAQIVRALRAMEAYRGADAILSYVEYRSEVITSVFIDSALAEGRQVFVPRVTGDMMDFYQIDALEELMEGYRGIREPAAGQLWTKDAGNTLMLMPGAAFDKACHRIGYGKGFYDRYLRRLADAGIHVHTLALCYECQVLAKIPYEIHDIRPDMVLTENSLYGQQ